MSQVLSDVPGAVPAPCARRAADRRVDLDVLGGAERRLLEVDLEADQGVLAAALPRTRPALRAAAEERVHDVGEAEARLPEAAAAVAAAGRRRGRRSRFFAGSESTS